MVNWNEVCRPLKEGGLGITPIQEVNAALLTKWWWKWKVDPNAFWVEICDSIFKGGKHKKSIWKNSIEEYREWIADFTYGKVGDGRQIFFWKDRWLLKEKTIGRNFLHSTKSQRKQKPQFMRVENGGKWAWHGNYHSKENYEKERWGSC